MIINESLVISQERFMKSLKGITSFVCVANCGSFTSAAKLQGVSAVAVSKNVATLEQQLGVRLFHRTTRKLSLTQEGQAFYEQCKGPLRELEAAQAVVKQSKAATSGLLRVTCLSPLAIGFVIPLLGQFERKYPKVQIELHSDDTVSDMVAKGYDVGVRVGVLRDSTQIARPIAPIPFVICAHPDYLKRKGVPQTLADLATHNCIKQLQPSKNDVLPWSLRGMTQELSKSLSGSLIVNDFSAAVLAAVHGLGLIYAPLPLVMPLFRTRELIPVLTSHIESKIEAYLHYPNRKNLPARTQVFVAFMLEHLRQEKDLQTPAAELLMPFV
jgi:DNA-binding transcriptional LysR family regulator